MKIPVTLNGQKTILEANPDTPLSLVLRSNKLFSVKKGGKIGSNSFCTILLDDKPVPSDIIPFALVKNTTIITLEYFMQTDDYKDIAAGFLQAGIKLCGYCNADKIFTAWDIIKNSSRPSIDEIKMAIANMSFCCTNERTYIAGIRNASALRNKRFIGTKRNVRK